jgi:hypothetical protein
MEENIMKVIISNPAGRTFNIEAQRNQSFDIIWASVKSWFMPGSVVTITNPETGGNRSFTR